MPFEFADAQGLVLHDGELLPLERLLREQPDAGLYAHRVLRYGLGGLLVSNAPGPDLPAPERMFIPRPLEAETLSQLSLSQAGQFANDLAYDPEILSREDAYWVYEEANDTFKCQNALIQQRTRTP